MPAQQFSDQYPAIKQNTQQKPKKTQYPAIETELNHEAAVTKTQVSAASKMKKHFPSASPKSFAIPQKYPAVSVNIFAAPPCGCACKHLT